MNKEDVDRWIREGLSDGQRYLLIVQDGFSHEYTPDYAGNIAKARERISQLNKKDMLKVVVVVQLNGAQIDDEKMNRILNNNCWDLEGGRS